MNKLILDIEHKDKLISMIIDDDTHLGDSERMSLFYIIAGNLDLYRKRNFIYNIKTHGIYPDFEETSVDFSSGIKSLIKLGYNLYNGWADETTTPLYILASLDDENFKLAYNAMDIRFNSGRLKELQEEILR